MLLSQVSFLHSDEADDSAGERGSEPQHQPGQHTETVRGREEQGRWEKGHRQAGAAAGKAEGGTVIIITFYKPAFNQRVCLTRLKHLPAAREPR